MININQIPTPFGNKGLQPFSFTLASTVTTSAGIFKINDNGDDVLVRTLWSSVVYNPGTYSYTWDGTDDLGNLLPNGNYKWRIVTNNIQYTWQGIIGNTSSSFTGSNVHKGNREVTSLCITGNNAYYGLAYNEQNTCTIKFLLTDIQNAIRVDYAGYGSTPNISDATTDGNYVYWSGSDPNSANNKFIYATKVSDNTVATFSSGSNYQLAIGHSYSVIGLINSSTADINSITVQQSGNLLFAARPNINSVHVYDKNTGFLLQTIVLNGVNQVRIDNTDSFIWIGYNNTKVEKFSINADGTITTTGLFITSNQPTVAIAISPDNNTLIVAEGGTNQILKAYNPVNVALLWSFGQTGGYLGTSIVSNDRFYWNDINNTYKVFITFAPDGSFWVGDPGNCRIQHYSINRIFIENIMFMSFNYNVNVDGTNPTRVFGNALEYQIDYSKPIAPDNSSWKLVRNWGGQLTKIQNSQYHGLKCAYTFPNGKTFCLLGNNSTWQLAELQSNGVVRFTAQTYSTLVFLKDGDLYTQTTYRVGSPLTFSKASFTGSYDANGTPVWAAFNVIESIPVIIANDPIYRGDLTHYRPAEITSGGVHASFDEQIAGKIYHVGGIKNGQWIFKTALSTFTGYRGDFPSGDRFDIGNQVIHAGGILLTLDNTLFWNYTGEFWGGSQTNKYNHVHESGLMLNQFGVAYKYTPQQRQGVLAMDAGNAYSFNVVKVNSRVFIYHNDEGIHSGVHRWEVTGMNTISEINGSVKLDVLEKGVVSEGYSGFDFNNLNNIRKGIDFHFSVPTDLLSTSDFSLRKSGYVNITYPETYTFYVQTAVAFRLYINDVLVIDGSNNDSQNELSGTVAFTSTGRYAFILESLFPSGSQQKVLFLYSSLSTPKMVIPFNQFTPTIYTDTVDPLKGINLFKGLFNYSGGALTANSAGWSFSSLEQSTGVNHLRNIYTGYTVLDKKSPDLYMAFGDVSISSLTATRDFGTALKNYTIQNWSLNSIANFSNGLDNSNENEHYFDVLDNKQRFTNLQW
jgi:hypothetical protein